MTQQINGQLGDWASKYAKAKPIEVSKMGVKVREGQAN